MKHGWVITEDVKNKWFLENKDYYSDAIEDAMVFGTRRGARDEKRTHEKIRKVSVTVKIIPGR